MNHNYAYLGEVTTETFKEIVRAFPNIVGIDATDDGNIVLGVSADVDENVIGMYQLIVAIYGNDRLCDAAWKAVENETL